LSRRIHLNKRPARGDTRRKDPTGIYPAFLEKVHREKTVLTDLSGVMDLRPRADQSGGLVVPLAAHKPLIGFARHGSPGRIKWGTVKPHPN